MTKSRTHAATLACALLLAGAGAADAAKPTRFWNLTGQTISGLALAPAGTDKFGPNEVQNDKDGDVDHDERLKLPNVASGTYDVKLTDKKGRTCIAKNVAVKEGDVFAIEAKQLVCPP